MIENPKEKSSIIRQTPAVANNEELTVGKVFWGSKTVSFYFNLIKYPVASVAAIEVFYLLNRNAAELVWLLDFLALGGICVIALIKHKSGLKELLIASGLGGLIIGFVSALAKLIYFHKFYLFFNLISEPVITALAGLGIGLVAGYISIFIFRGKSADKFADANTKNKKGGE